LAKLDSITTTAAPTTSALAKQEDDRQCHDVEASAVGHSPRHHEHVMKIV